MSGTTDISHENYGNYRYTDGSVMVWVPAFFYKIAANNAITIASEANYADEATANAAGFALHRAFKDGGSVRRGFFVDKYGCSNNGGVASSIRNGLPLSGHADHNPVAGLTGVTVNNYAAMIDAAKTRGSIFACCSRFIYAALAMLSMAHGQAAANATFCAWHHATNNFPKGCNNNALGDSNDSTIKYVSDGYSNCGKTGSGTPFAKTTHNGQASGVADLNGNMWEVSLGMVRPGTTAAEAIQDNLGTAKFHVLKDTVRISDLTSGWNGANDAWGTDATLNTNYEEISLAHIARGGAWQRFGSAANQVLDGANSGDGWTKTGLGFYRDANAKSAAGTNLFGSDGIYEYHRANLCLISGGDWSSGALSGVWAAALHGARAHGPWAVGFRSACYLV